MKSVSKGYAYGLASAIIYSAVSILGKLVMTRGVEPGVLIFWQYFGVIGLLSLYFFLGKKLPRIKSLTLPLIGLLSVLANLAFYFSMDYIGAGLATLILYFSSAITALFFFITGIRKISPWAWLAILLALVGSALSLEVFSGFNFDIRGVLLGLLASLIYSFYGLGLDLKLKDEDFLVINFYICLQGLVITSLLNFSKGHLAWAMPAKDILILIAIGLLGGVVPNFLNFLSIGLIGAEKTAVIMSVELPATVLMAFVFLSERLELFQTLGIVLVLVSVILLRYLERPGEDGGDIEIYDNKEGKSQLRTWGES